MERTDCNNERILVMGKLEKAEKLYLRGFCGEYIRRRTGMSIQQLLKQLLSNGVTYTKTDIVKYQVAYIQSHYTIEDIEAAYRHISVTYENLEKASRGKHIECLGCGFGQHAVVFSQLLGEERYKELRAEQ